MILTAIIRLILVASGSLALLPSAHAQSVLEERSSWLDRVRFLDGPGGPREQLRERGIELDGNLTQFYQGVVSGDGDRDWQYGGKFDLLANVDGGKIGLWKGLSLNVHQEWLYGEDANRQGDGSLIPLDTGLAFPALGGHERETAVVLTETLGERFSISLGKFNLLDMAAKTPLVGGGGLETFMNTAIAAPISGVTPAYLLGTIATLKTDPAIFTLMVYDPRNAQDWDVIAHPFSKGTTASLTVTVPTKIAGLPGLYGLRGAYSSKTGFDLADVPELLLPPAAQGDLSKEGYWFVSATMQQYLWQDASNPAVGWGVFADVGLSDGNPNPVHWHAFAGLGGQGPMSDRPLDRWGIGYFKYSLSNDLLDSLESIGIGLTDEKGLEAYYNLALTPWFRITADVQWIDPHQADKDDAVIAALRSQTKF